MKYWKNWRLCHLPRKSWRFARHRPFKIELRPCSKRIARRVLLLKTSGNGIKFYTWSILCAWRRLTRRVSSRKLLREPDIMQPPTGERVNHDRIDRATTTVGEERRSNPHCRAGNWRRGRAHGGNTI